jgi:hypothetical protein
MSIMATQPAYPGGPYWVTYPDVVGFWIGPGWSAEPMSGMRKRAGRLRRQAKRLGLSPCALYLNAWGAGFTVSLGPIWNQPPVNLEARAAGTDPCDLLSLIEVAEKVGARVTRLDLAIDLLGVPAKAAHSMFFPSCYPGTGERTEDLFRLRGRTPKPGKPCSGTDYERSRRSSRNKCIYSDRPSKVAPDDGPALHCDAARLKADHLPKEFRKRGGLRFLLTLAQPHRILAIIDPHVIFGTEFASRARGDNHMDEPRRRGRSRVMCGRQPNPVPRRSGHPHASKEG